MEYPLFLYKKGNPFITATAHDDDERKALIADGWKGSVPELDGESATQEPPKTTQEPPKAEPVADDGDDNRPPTREELEAKAKELGLKYHHRTGDAKLAEMIDEAMSKADPV